MIVENRLSTHISLSNMLYVYVDNELIDTIQLPKDITNDAELESLADGIIDSLQY